MTTFTCYDPVFAKEGILRVAIMVEEKHFPVSLGVATFTGLAKAPLMDIVILVTGVAVTWSFVFVKMPSVAVLALRHSMPSFQ